MSRRRQSPDPAIRQTKACTGSASRNASRELKLGVTDDLFGAQSVAFRTRPQAWKEFPAPTGHHSAPRHPRSPLPVRGSNSSADFEVLPA